MKCRIALQAPFFYFNLCLSDFLIFSQSICLSYLPFLFFSIHHVHVKGDQNIKFFSQQQGTEVTQLFPVSFPLNINIPQLKEYNIWIRDH